MQYQIVKLDSDGIVTPGEAAERLRVDIGAIYYLVKTGKVANHGSLTRYMVALDDVQAYLPILKARKRDAIAAREAAPSVSVGDLIVWLRWGLVSEYEGKGVVYLHDDTDQQLGFFRKDKLDDWLLRGDMRIVKPITMLATLADYISEYHNADVGAQIAALARQLRGDA